jgi:hypothetical protein
VQTIATTFVSYSRLDAQFVSKLVSDLGDLGFEVLLDKKHLTGGRSTRTEIQSKIAQSDYLLPVMSRNSVRSEWVRPVEIAWALRLQKDGRRLRILPLLLDEGRLKFEELDGLNYIDFRSNHELALAKLVQALPNAGYDEIANLREELDNEKVSEKSLLSILRRMVTRPRKSRRQPTWSDYSAKQFVRELRRIVKDEDAIDDVYWWLIVYGVLRFKDIDKFWDGKDTYQNSIKYAEIAPRGLALLNDLATAHAAQDTSATIRRSSSRARPRKRRTLKK